MNICIFFLYVFVLSIYAVVWSCHSLSICLFLLPFSSSIRLPLFRSFSFPLSFPPSLLFPSFFSFHLSTRLPLSLPFVFAYIHPRFLPPFLFIIPYQDFLFFLNNLLQPSSPFKATFHPTHFIHKVVICPTGCLSGSLSGKVSQENLTRKFLN